MKYSELNTLLKDTYLANATRDELKDLQEAFEARGEALSDFSVLVVPEATIHDMLNELTYDTYGRLRRDCKSFSAADIAACRIGYVEAVGHDYPGIPRASLLSMCDFLEDLWQSNEDESYNNPDGTYNTQAGDIEESSAMMRKATKDMTMSLSALSSAIVEATDLIRGRSLRR